MCLDEVECDVWQGAGVYGTLAWPWFGYLVRGGREAKVFYAVLYICVSILSCARAWMEKRCICFSSEGKTKYIHIRHCVSSSYIQYSTHLSHCLIHYLGGLNWEPIGIRRCLPLERPLKSVHDILKGEGANGRARDGVLWGGEDAIHQHCPVASIPSLHSLRRCLCRGDEYGKNWFTREQE